MRLDRALQWARQREVDRLLTELFPHAPLLTDHDRIWKSFERGNGAYSRHKKIKNALGAGKKNPQAVGYDLISLHLQLRRRKSPYANKLPNEIIIRFKKQVDF